jgi:uncharacterized membrane protein
MPINEVLLEKILSDIILGIVMVVCMPIVLLFLVMILIIDSITSSHGVYIDEENFKYKNPPVSKNVIMFENQINWNEPITLVEGVFDAMAVKRNAIPLLGKFIPKKLNDSIYNNEVKKINILLDEDAQEQALRHTMQFQNQGIETTNILPSRKRCFRYGI